MGEFEMEVRLTRSPDESWGFRLLGGIDFNMPLTVVRVVPNSPADKAGLHNGDAVTTIAGQDATGLSHDDSRRILAAAQETLTIGFVRGLYDPVLDDFEPLYEQIDQADFDQPSAPTEVPPDHLDISVSLPDFTSAAVDSKQAGVIKPDVIGNADDYNTRSLTASPFLLPTKPYRPFSTEPLAEVPPLEDPIILNPSYHDEFCQLKDEGERLPGTRFKLPISEQYDPDGTKQKMREKETQHVTVKEFSTAVKEEMIKESKEVAMKKEFEMKDQAMTKSEVIFLEDLKKEIDLEKIEMTATSIVDESIQTAVTLAEEIKKEIDVELTETFTNGKESIAAFEAKTESITNSEVHDQASTRSETQKVAAKDVKKLVEVIDETTEEIVKTNGHEEELSTSQFDETTTVINKQYYAKEVNKSKTESSMTEQEEVFTKQKALIKESVQETESFVEKDIQRKASKQEANFFNQTDVKESTTNRSQTAKGSTNTEARYTSSEQRAYTLGLQTIPNIRGTVISSSNFDLLLRTFFVHLTDVMVALSKFILAEPALLKADAAQEKTEIIKKQEQETVTKRKETVIDTEQKETKHTDAVVEPKKVKTDVEVKTVTQTKQQEKKAEIAQTQEDTKSKVAIVKEKKYTENEMNLIEQNAYLEQLEEKRKLSGSRMAQLVEKRPEALMKNMEAVITEFESKSGGQDIETVRERRSISRSRVNTPVEAFDKNSHEVSEFSGTVTSSSLKESKNILSESRTESLDNDATSKGKNTYIAIVESHVYTNKDAILEEHLDVSETTLDLSAKETAKFEAIAVDSSKAVVNEAELVKREEKFAQVGKAKEVIQEAIESKQHIVTNKETELVDKSQEIAVKEILQPMLQEKKPVSRRQQLLLRKAKVIKEEKVATKTEVMNKKVEDIIVIKENKAASKKEILSTKENVKIKQKEIALQERKPTLRRQQLVLHKAKNTKQEAVTTEIEVTSEKKEEQSAAKLEVLIKNGCAAKEQQKEELKQEIKEAVTIKQDASLESAIVLKQEREKIKIASAESIKTESILEETSSFSAATFDIKDKSKSQKVSVIQKSTAVLQDKKEQKSVDEVVFKFDFSKDSKERDELADLKISKEQFVEQEKTAIQLVEQTDMKMKKVLISELESQSEHIESKQIEQESDFISKMDQESSFVAKLDKQTSFVAKSLDKREVKEKLFLDTEKASKKAETQISEDSDISTPTPATVPPTPLTDEYVFTLTTTLPKRQGAPIPRDCTPSDDDEDPHIVKKGLVPHIDAELESPKIFDPPLASPPMSPKSPTSPKSTTSSKAPTRPKYCKPGLRGGADREYSKEEILEIERKSSLLASAIDQTIKSIEEYREEVGMKQQFQNGERKIRNGEFEIQNGGIGIQNGGMENQNSSESRQNGVIYNGYTTVVETKVFDTITQAATTDIITNGINGKPNETAQISDEPDTTIINEAVIIESFKPIVVNNIVSTAVNEEVITNADIEDKKDPLEGYKSVHFDIEELNALRAQRAALGIKIPQLTASQERELYKTEMGKIIGTHQGIVDGLHQAVVDTEVAKEMGKPGISEEKIAELISGESEMLREAHVMGLKRVLASHMHKDSDDSSVDFKRIKPIIESLKDSEVLKALNEEVLRTAEERKRKEQQQDQWTTFLQKPKRPVPRSKFGYYKDPEKEITEAYKVKIVKQPKPKVAPDYKPEDFNTGLLPWEERALREPTPPPVPPEDPILIPEDPPQVLEAVDPLPESEVPDLEDSGIPLTPPPAPKDPSPPPEEEPETQEEQLDIEAIVEETEKIVEENLAEEMEKVNLAEQLMMGVQNMVDPNAPLDQQLAQMRAQLAALSQLPGVIQQSLEMVTKQLSQLSHLEATETTPSIEEAPEAEADTTPAAVEDAEGTQSQNEPMTIEDVTQERSEKQPEENKEQTLTPGDAEKMKIEEEAIHEEQRRMEKRKKELMEAARLEHESRQVKQRPTPRVGKPKPVFGPVTPQERPLVLPGGRKWRKPQDAYNEALFAETLAAQAEIIAGKAKGINFMKYEKPPVSLEHLKDSDTYKMIHDLEMTPAKRVEMLTPVMAEADYREKCRSMTPCPERLTHQILS